MLLTPIPRCRLLAVSGDTERTKSTQERSAILAVPAREVEWLRRWDAGREKGRV
jgi:hypothetical protein